MRVLLDSCVLSEIRRVNRNDAVKAAVSPFNAENLFISILSVGEITKGISLLEDGSRKRALAGWLHSLERDHADRILPLDLDTAHTWGEVAAAAQSGRRALSAAGMIVATAHLRSMTRNVDDFSNTGVLRNNSWDSSNG